MDLPDLLYSVRRFTGGQAREVLVQLCLENAKPYVGDLILVAESDLEDVSSNYEEKNYESRLENEDGEDKKDGSDEEDNRDYGEYQDITYVKGEDGKWEELGGATDACESPTSVRASSSDLAPEHTYQNTTNGRVEPKRAANEILHCAHKKRAILRYEVCENCSKEYDVKYSLRGDCVYHTEPLDLDEESELWDDYEEHIFGPMDSEQNREQFPAGFRWACCDKQGDDEEEGCQQGRHIPRFFVSQYEQARKW